MAGQQQASIRDHALVDQLAFSKDEIEILKENFRAGDKNEDHSLDLVEFKTLILASGRGLVRKIFLI